MKQGILLFTVLALVTSCASDVKQKTTTMDKFTPADWVAGTNIYEVNLRQYTQEGTFAAFEQDLPRLRDMGVETLWFMPITPISKEKRLGTLGSYYACSDYTAVNPEYGTLNDFQSLVKVAHKLGFKIIIDFVANHTGWDHVWTKQHPEYYKRDSAGNFYDKNGWEDVIDLDHSKPEVRQALIDAMHFWVRECDIDGFRCDMAHLVPLDFWKKARSSFGGKNLLWLAETQEASFSEVFDVTYGWEFLHKMEAFWKKQTDIKGLDSVLQKYESITKPGAARVFFTSNHDENSHSGSEYERMGNAAKPFAVFCATWKNAMPLVYSGQELPNKKRLKFFDKDPIEWTGQYELHDFYKKLLTLHKSHPAMQLFDESVLTSRVQTTDDARIFAFVKQRGERQVLVLLNLSDSDKVRFDVTGDVVTGRYKSAFSGVESDFTAGRSFEMQRWEYLIYEK